MSMKGSLLSILGLAEQAQRAFEASLSEEQRSEVGTYESWCAKDTVAHIAYWQERQARRLAALARGEEPPPAPAHYEQANVECFERYCDVPWDEVQAYAKLARAQLAEAVRSLDEEMLTEPAPGGGERPLWEDIVGTGYSHPLIHLAELYTGQGQRETASQLWQEWGSVVAPLSDSPRWRGGVRYNLACSLAMLGSGAEAVAELRQALALRPGLTGWSRHDSDLQSLHDMPEYREIYAATHWWEAIEANPMAEAFADQFLRALRMLREAVKSFPAEEWRQGDTPYQRPAGLALHLLESLEGYCALKPGEAGADGRFDVNWQEKDSAKLPSQEDMLAYLDDVGEKVAGFLVKADLLAAEEVFNWTGSTLLSRAGYMLRHTQHHLADMCLELHRRGHQAPEWQ